MSRTVTLTLLLAVLQGVTGAGQRAECASGEQLELWVPLLGLAALSFAFERWVRA